MLVNVYLLGPRLTNGVDINFLFNINNMYDGSLKHFADCQCSVLLLYY